MSLGGVGSRGLSSSKETLSPVNVFIDPVDGRDTNRWGREQDPFQTLDPLQRILPGIIQSPTFVRVVRGTYNISEPLLQALRLGRPLIFMADEVRDPLVYRTVAAGVCEAGTTGSIINFAAAAQDQFDGTTLEVAISGDNSIRRRPLGLHPAGQLTPWVTFSDPGLADPAPGDTFRILRSDQVLFRLPPGDKTHSGGYDAAHNGSLIYAGTQGPLGASVSGTPAADAMLGFVGIRFFADEFVVGSFEGVNVQFMGCELDGTNFETFLFCNCGVGFGYSSTGGMSPIPDYLGLVRADWKAWGMRWDGLLSPVFFSSAAGLSMRAARVEVGGLGSTTASSAFIVGNFFGGGVPFSVPGDASVLIGANAQATLGFSAGNTRAFSSADPDDAVICRDGGFLQVNRNVTITPVDGHALRMRGRGIISVLNNANTVEPSGTGDAMHADSGGKGIISGGAPTFGGAQNFVAGTLVPVVGTNASFPVDGSNLSHADTSSIERQDG